MILLFSPKDDIVTRRVAKLLSHVGADFLEVSDELLVRNTQFEVSDRIQKDLVLQGTAVPSQDVRAIWFYRFLRCPSDLYDTLSDTLNPQVANQVSAEVVRLYGFIPQLFPSAFILGDVERSTTNKLVELLNAKKSGLSIPDTYVISEKERLLSLYEKYPSGLVAKSMYNGQVLYLREGRFPMYAKTVQRDDLTNLPRHFVPSLVQEKMEKEYDVRVFYLLGECFAIRISTGDLIQHVDYRAYGGLEKSRFSRYDLDEELARKIGRFMCLMGLNMGSLDFVLTKDNEMRFLEVNNNGSLETPDRIYDYAISRTIVEQLYKLNYQ